MLPHASCGSRKHARVRTCAQVHLQSATVYVDRDQRWVFGCLGASARPATETPNLTLSITGSTQESMVHCTHRHAISLPVCRALPSSASFFVPVPPPPGRRKNPHRIPGIPRLPGSLAHKPSFIGRTDDTIKLVLPRLGVVGASNFFSALPLTPGPTHGQHSTLSKRHICL